MDQEQKVADLVGRINEYLTLHVGSPVESADRHDLNDFRDLVGEMLDLKYIFGSPIQFECANVGDGRLVTIVVPTMPIINSSDDSLQKFLEESTGAARMLSSTLDDVLRLSQAVGDQIRGRREKRLANDIRVAELSVAAFGDNAEAAQLALTEIDTDRVLTQESKEFLRTIISRFFPELIRNTIDDLEAKLDALEAETNLSGDLEGAVWQDLSAAYTKYGRTVMQTQIDGFNTISEKRRLARKARK